MAKTIEARLVITGEDRASQLIDKITTATKRFARDADLSATMRKNADAAAKTEQAFNAVAKAMAGREGFAKAQSDLKSAEAGLRVYTKELDAARQAKVAFGNVKPASGTEEAARYTAATKALREATVAQQRAEREVVKMTAAVGAQAAAMKQADSAAAHLGADLSNLEAHQRRLKTSYEATTTALGREIQMQDRASAAAKRHALEQAEQARHARRHGVISVAATAASGAVGVHGVIHTAERAAHAGAEVQRERVRLEQAGVPAAERSHIADESLQLAIQTKNVTQAGVMELWKELRSVMTDPHEVDHIIGPMVKAKSILDAGDSTGTASHGLNLLVKGAEVIGAAKDPERFTHLLDGYVKAMQVMGKTITPEGVYEMQKYSKAAGARWSDRFILTTGLSLGQEMGGSTAGNSIQMAQKQIVGGMQNLHSKAKEFARIGLIDEKNLDYLKTGEVKGVKAGVKHAVKGDDLAATDLDQWVYTVLLPALNKGGVQKESDQLAWIQKNFTSTAADVISKMVMQKESFEAHAKMYEGAAGLKGQAQNRDDALAGLGAVSKSLETFAGVVTGPVMKDAAHGLDAIAGRIGSFSTSLEAFNKAHPEIAKYEGPAAAGAGLLGAGAASAAVWKLLNGGFGLKGSAVALDGSAAALTAAAVKLGGGLPGGALGGAPGPDAGKTKGGRLKGVLKAGASVGGLLALEPLADEAQKRGIFALPNLNDGLARAGLDFLDPRLGNAVLGDRLKAMPSMAIKPGPAPLTLDGSGLNSFGLTGPQSPEALAKRDADRYTRGLVEARRTAAPLNPGDELFGLGSDLATKAQEKGTEAGTKAGRGIAEGVQSQAPVVEQQGRSIMQRLQELFSAGIFVPINLKVGEGMGGGAGSGSGSGGGPGGLIHRASLGGEGSLGGGGVGGLIRQGGSGAPNANFTPGNAQALKNAAAELGTSPTDLATVIGYETKGTFSPSIIGGAGNRYQGLIQFGPTERKQYGANGGQTFAEQMPAVVRYLKGRGFKPGMGLLDLYSTINAGRPGLYNRRDMNGSVREHVDRMRAGQGARARMFLDGKGAAPATPPEPPPQVAVPDAPAVNTGGGRGGEMERAADRFHSAAERFEKARMDGTMQIQISGSASGRARVTGMRARGSGAISADMGVSMPRAKESDGDWV